MKLKRILLKLSGEALSSRDSVFDRKILDFLAAEIKKIQEIGIEIGIVCGGGNILRGAAFSHANDSNFPVNFKIKLRQTDVY